MKNQMFLRLFPWMKTVNSSSVARGILGNPFSEDVPSFPPFPTMLWFDRHWTASVVISPLGTYDAM